MWDNMSIDMNSDKNIILKIIYVNGTQTNGPVSLWTALTKCHRLCVVIDYRN